jgi:2-(1,2-epoxy-1,2-dihydrophenyl)acetyl-CoA isomerase
MSLLVDDHDGVRTFTLNRPEAFNSLTVALKESLRDALRETAEDPKVRAVVLTGRRQGILRGPGPERTRSSPERG